jgi:protein TonB
METNHTTSENLNDLIFENRNKAYGAYAIRNSYNDNVSVSLLIAILLSASLAFLTFLFNNNDKILPIAQGQVAVPDLFTIDVDLTPPATP